MTLIRRPAPFADVVSLRDAVERLFDDRFLRPLASFDGDGIREPALDVYTTPEAVIAKAALPGVKPDDVEITITDDVVSIKGTFAAEQEVEAGGYIRKELSHGHFERAFAAPTAVRPEGASAVFKDGLLTLTLPKSEAVKPQHVKVTAA